MKRYDLSKVMKGAHNMYRTGKYASFSAALKRSWKVVKFSAGIKACLPAVEAGIAEKERINAKRKAVNAAFMFLLRQKNVIPFK